MKRQSKAIGLCYGEEIIRDCSLALLTRKQSYTETIAQEWGFNWGFFFYLLKWWSLKKCSKLYSPNSLPYTRNFYCKNSTNSCIYKVWTSFVRYNKTHFSRSFSLDSDFMVNFEKDFSLVSFTSQNWSPCYINGKDIVEPERSPFARSQNRFGQVLKFKNEKKRKSLKTSKIKKCTLGYSWCYSWPYHQRG